MTGLRAALYKDFQLFFRGAGLLALILPFLLLLALYVGMSDSSEQVSIQPFPIAVRDQDNTVMSRSLISQMARIQLFSQIIPVEEGESDGQMLSLGAAAVVTIPKDFFYDLYKMQDCPVDVTLNGDMELEATLFQSIFSSVMDIIQANQSAGRGVYRFCYGELTEELEWAMYAESSEYLFQDALSRQTVFDSAAEQSDIQGALERRLLASLLAVLALFFALSAVKTLPEEMSLGVLPRYQAVGGSLAAFVGSKFLASLLLPLPTLALVVFVFPSSRTVQFFLTFLALSFGAFGLLLAAASLAGSAAALQRWGNLFLLLSLVLGGTLWPRSLLPGPLRALSGLTLPYYGILGLEATERGASPAGLLILLWPVWCMGAAGGIVAIYGLSRRRSGRQTSSSLPSVSLPPETVKLRGPVWRLVGLSRMKLFAMAGGAHGLAALLAVALLCGVAAAAVQTGGAANLRLAVCDLDESSLSQELVQRLSSQPGLSLVFCQEEQGERALMLGETEGLLVIDSGYGRALEEDAPLSLRYDSSSSAVSAQGAREIIAGQVVVQRSRLRAVTLAANHVGRSLSQEETALLFSYIDQAEREAAPLYRVQTGEGTPLPDPFMPSQMSFAALAVLLTLLTAAPWSGADGRLVERRMEMLPYGRVLSYGSDCLALAVLGLLGAAAVLLPGGFPKPAVLLAALSYALCTGALALVLIRFTALEGRVDGLAPFLALILCLLGGCFMDLSQLSPTMARLTLLTPPGLAAQAAGGSMAASAVLLVESAILFLLGMRRGRD